MQAASALYRAASCSSDMLSGTVFLENTQYGVFFVKGQVVLV